MNNGQIGFILFFVNFFAMAVLFFIALDRVISLNGNVWMLVVIGVVGLGSDMTMMWLLMFPKKKHFVDKFGKIKEYF